MNYLEYYCETFGLEILLDEDLVVEKMCWTAVGKIVEDGKYVHFFGQLNPIKTSDLLLPALENFGVH